MFAESIPEEDLQKRRQARRAVISMGIPLFICAGISVNYQKAASKVLLLQSDFELLTSSTPHATRLISL
jgi:hypothetical protein